MCFTVWGAKQVQYGEAGQNTILLERLRCSSAVTDGQGIAHQLVSPGQGTAHQVFSAGKNTGTAHQPDSTHRSLALNP